MVTVPNALSVMRLILVPVLYLLALQDMHAAFLGVLVVSFLTDLVDGPIARRLNQMSDIGAQLDSWADFAVYVSLPIWGAWLWPEIITIQRPYITAVLVSYMAPVIVGVIKYGRLPSLHTYGAKLSAICIGCGAILMFGFEIYLPFRLCVPLALATAIDEIFTITLLRSWRPNVKSSWHAVRLRRTGQDIDHVPNATASSYHPRGWKQD